MTQRKRSARFIAIGVGQGDAFFLERGGCTILVDGGRSMEGFPAQFQHLHLGIAPIQKRPKDLLPDPLLLKFFGSPPCRLIRPLSPRHILPTTTRDQHI